MCKILKNRGLNVDRENRIEHQATLV